MTVSAAMPRKKSVLTQFGYIEVSDISCQIFSSFFTHPPPFTFSKEFIDTSKHFLSKKQSLKNRRRKRSMIKKREDELIDFS